MDMEPTQASMPEQSSQPKKKSKKGLIWILAVFIIIILILILLGKKNSEGEYTATIHNISVTQPLSPGVYAVHDKTASFDFEKKLSPAELEPLAEFGSTANFAAWAQARDGVIQVITLEDAIAPGDSATIAFSAPKGKYYLSGIQMAMASNDGFILLDAARLINKKEAVFETTVYDNGTEENSELGSGFVGGQPDSTQGDLNIANGTKTDPQAKVRIHPQLTNQLAEITITPVK